MLHCF